MAEQAQRQAAAAERASAHIDMQASTFAQQAQAELLRLQQEADYARAQGAELEADKAELLLQRRAAAEAAQDAERNAKLDFERLRSAAEEALRHSKMQADADVATIYDEAKAEVDRLRELLARAEAVSNDVEMTQPAASTTELLTHSSQNGAATIQTSGDAAASASPQQAGYAASSATGPPAAVLFTWLRHATPSSPTIAAPGVSIFKGVKPMQRRRKSPIRHPEEAKKWISRMSLKRIRIYRRRRHRHRRRRQQVASVQQ